jgi:acetyl-CoA synthetase
MSQETPGSAAIAAPAGSGGTEADAAAAHASSHQPAHQGDAFENLLHEDRRFAPSEEFVASAVVTEADYAEADADRPAFWARQARELLTWDQDFTQALSYTHLRDH